MSGSEPTRGGVLVTGASTGIGEATVLRLDKLGFHVFAGVRKEADGERLRTSASERLRIVHPVDVTNADDIAAAARFVEAELAGKPLSGIVNNAGIALGGPLEALDLDDLRRQLEVNTVAPLAVAQAFLPALRSSGGRIVNISSIGGRVAQPFVGPYVTSKFGIEALTDVLRLELMDWDIEVVAIEPGTVSTPIWEKGSSQVDAELERLTPAQRDLYGKRLAKMAKLLERQTKRGVSPDKVAQAIEKALTASRPRTRYLVGDAHVLLALKTLLPTRLVDKLLYRATS
jgi:NAD(P)-dependent dehydrogenase (short-subunit alcohol dehydrogenase family)